MVRYVWAILDRVLKEGLSEEGGFDEKPEKLGNCPSQVMLTKVLR